MIGYQLTTVQMVEVWSIVLIVVCLAFLIGDSLYQARRIIDQARAMVSRRPADEPSDSERVP